MPVATTLPQPEGSAAALLRQLGATSALDAAPWTSPRPFPVHVVAKKARPTNLLIVGCGRSGTHALTALLRRHGIAAMHEAHGREVTLGWPYTGHIGSAAGVSNWKEIWPMGGQPRPNDSHEPIFKLHRHPLFVLPSIAAGFTSSGRCRWPSERRWDARAWRCASSFVSLPVTAQAITDQTTCSLAYEARLRLALHYWVKWNLLGDRWANRKFQVENMSVDEIVQAWCAHCKQTRSCTCPQSAELLARNSSTGNSSTRRVRPTKGHGRKRAAITWEMLSSIDPAMTRVAQAMTLEYGYSLNGTNATAP